MVIETWFLLYNLKKLLKLDLVSAGIRKFGRHFVAETQLISQLEKIYGRKTRITTGSYGIKIVMNVPEPIIEKYMPDFLGEKEEITFITWRHYSSEM